MPIEGEELLPRAREVVATRVEARAFGEGAAAVEALTPREDVEAPPTAALYHEGSSGVGPWGQADRVSRACAMRRNTEGRLAGLGCVRGKASRGVTGIAKEALNPVYLQCRLNKPKQFGGVAMVAGELVAATGDGHLLSSTCSS